jgi:hypothetical protein
MMCIHFVSFTGFVVQHSSHVCYDIFSMALDIFQSSVIKSLYRFDTLVSVRSRLRIHQETEFQEEIS